jgi:molybdopterin-guanine dinucleotide biosynthesis protein A
MRSAIILAGGRSRRLGTEKGLLLLGEQSLIEHVCKCVYDATQEVIVAVGSRKQKGTYSRLLQGCSIVVDEVPHQGPLAGVWSGLKVTTGENVAIIGCDMPMISTKGLNILFERCAKHDAVIPRWSNGYIEPLYSVYNTNRCRKAVAKALEIRRRDMQALLKNLSDVLFVSAEVIQRQSGTVSTFFNINTISDLDKARSFFEEPIAAKQARLRGTRNDSRGLRLRKRPSQAKQ